MAEISVECCALFASVIAVCAYWSRRLEYLKWSFMFILSWVRTFLDCLWFSFYSCIGVCWPIFLFCPVSINLDVGQWYRALVVTETLLPLLVFFVTSLLSSLICLRIGCIVLYSQVPLHGLSELSLKLIDDANVKTTTKARQMVCGICCHP